MNRLTLNIRSAFVGNLPLELNVKVDLSLGITQVCGANGSGKTTFLSALAGARDFNGSVQMDGIDLHEQPNQYKRRVGYCPHAYEFIEHISPCQYLGFVAQCFNYNFADGFGEMYSEIGFQWRRGQLIRHLSCGNKKSCFYWPPFWPNPIYGYWMSLPMDWMLEPQIGWRIG